MDIQLDNYVIAKLYNPSQNEKSSVIKNTQAGV